MSRDARSSARWPAHLHPLGCVDDSVAWVTPCSTPECSPSTTSRAADVQGPSASTIICTLSRPRHGPSAEGSNCSIRAEAASVTSPRPTPTTRTLPALRPGHSQDRPYRGSLRRWTHSSPGKRSRGSAGSTPGCPPIVGPVLARCQTRADETTDGTVSAIELLTDRTSDARRLAHGLP